MCIIVYKKEGIKLPDMSILKNCWDGNSHGAGFMYRKKSVMGNRSIVIEKGFMTWESFKKRIGKFKTYEGEMCIHFRLASHGCISENNCHPWEILKNESALCHNGIISWLGDDKTVSDSMRFADLLKSFDLENPDHVVTLEHAIGTYNKVVIMDAYANTVILNHNQGVISNDIWYSNRGFGNTYDITEVIESKSVTPRRKGGYLSWLANEGWYR